MSDEEMMSLMRACMLAPDRDPLPSVETPLHSLLPARFVAHTHDVATLSLTDTPSAEKNVRRVFGPEVAFLEYVRPGFPLAKRLAERFADGPPGKAIALVMEKHGLAVWGETAKECWGNLRAIIGQAEEYVAEAREGEAVFGAAVAPVLDDERAEEDRGSGPAGDPGRTDARGLSLRAAPRRFAGDAGGDCGRAVRGGGVAGGDDAGAHPAGGRAAAGRGVGG